MAKCIYCDNSDFLMLVDKPDYRFLIYSSETEGEWVLFPLLIGCCKRCGITTLLRLPEKELINRIYGRYYRSYPSCAPSNEVEQRMQEFFSAFRSFPDHGSVLEIGSYNGELLNILKCRGFQVLGCDPNSSAAACAMKAYGIETIQGYFQSNLFLNAQFDLVLSRLLLEHVLEPQTLWEDLNRVIKLQGKMAHEVPNCQYAFEHGIPFFLPEHSTFFTSNSLKRVAESAGFEVNHVQTTPGFLRMMATKTRKITGLSLRSGDSKASIAQDLRIAERFVEKFCELIRRADVCLEQAREKGLGIAIYGVGYFFTYLSAFTTLNCEEIVCATDSNPSKWGTQFPCLREPVQPPERIRYPEIGLVVVATQSYEGVLSRLTPYLEQGGKALVFLPEPRVVGA